MSPEPESIDEKKDVSPYIRTFAKDLAAISAKNPELTKNYNSKKKQKPPKQPESKQAVSPAPVQVKKPETLEAELDAGAARMQTEGVATVEKATSATVELPRIEVGDIVSPPPAAPEVPVSKSPVIETPEIPAPQEPTNEERAAILARLKARVDTKKPEAVTPAPVVREAAPEITIPEAKNEAPSPIHTYKSDFSDRIDEQHASTFSVLAAQKDAPRRQVVRTKNSNVRVLPIVAGIIFIVVGTGAIFAAFLYVSRNTAPIGIMAPPSLITPDSSVKLSGNGSTLKTALAEQANLPVPANNVLLTYVDESTTTAQGVVEEQATGGAFITELNLQAPDILLRNTDPSSMVGIVHAGLRQPHSLFCA